MTRGGKRVLQSASVLALVICFWAAGATGSREAERSIYARSNPDAPLPPLLTVADSLLPDSLQPIWPNQDGPYPDQDPSGINLPLPDNISYTVEYNAATGQYEVVQNIGDSLRFRNPSSMTLDEYLQYDMRKTLDDWWTEQQEELDEEERSPVIPTIEIGGKGFETLFGGNEIEFRMQGSAELIFGMNISKTENPRIPLQQQTISTFNFDQRIQMNLTGNIGTKMQLQTNFNTEATFDFENTMNLGYEGSEDEIIKNIEAGNVTMPLNSSLIQGSQSLFGLKVETQWGRLRNTSVFSQQRGERKEIEVQGGAQTQQFEIQGDNYDANRHYFLSNWFRDQYDGALESLPVVNSGVNITRIEVWVVNTQANTTDVRNVIAFSDLGEQSDYMFSEFQQGVNPAFFDNPETSVTLQGNPSNTNNDIYPDMVDDPAVMEFNGANAAIQAQSPLYQQGIQFERVGNARKLNASEFTFNSRLGFISLRQALNNAEVLAVAYEYTLGGETYKVGTLSQDGFTAPNALILKMLKSSITQVQSPIWDLMMKNVYNIGAFGVSNEDFRLNVWYNNPSTGVPQNYIPYEPLDDKLLMQVLNMDKLDVNGMPNPDGVFDYVDNAATQGGLINSQNGRIYLPNVEPFGTNLSNKIEEGLGGPTAEGDALIDQIVYQELYDSTKTAAQQIPSKNRFSLQGQFQSSSSSEIALNAFNIPQGSVTVTAGGNRLIENQDYTVDYQLGRVRIINEGILQSGTPIKISLESNSLFSIQTKTMLGTRFDYEISDNFKAGATILNLRERPLTQKVNIGQEPINNTILGTDLAFQRESEWLTRLVDKIPFYDTKAPSNIDFAAEAAYLIPGHSRAIGDEGNAYLDDFEGSQSTIDIRSINQWFLASTPKANNLFPEGNLEDNLAYNYNRAKLSWYVIDPQFWLSSSLPDGSVDDEVRSDHRMREVLENEVFPNKELPPGTPPNIPTLDLTFYPDERGPYNYVPFEGGDGAAGMNPDGSLLDPGSRWGGIQRALTTTDFETSNIEFIQFWLMDPFNQDSENLNGGKLYFNLGNVSEDVLNDSQLSYENGFPTTTNPLPTLETTWGQVPDPATFNVVNAFEVTGNQDPNIATYGQQDIGLDGLNNAAEQEFFSDWIASLQAVLDPNAYNAVVADPSADNYEHFRRPNSEGLDIITRYKDFNGNEDNANTTEPNGYPINATTIPNTEDINQDLTLNTIESYYQYEVDLTPGALGEGSIGTNYITDSFVQTIEDLPNGETKAVRWYQFKIPVAEYDARIGQISDFRSIRYIRMFMQGWSEEATLRFARLELVRGEWRRYLDNLLGPGEYEPGDPDNTTFNIGAVNIEENGNRDPVNYVVPPGIIREVDVGAANFRSLNEQSMALEVCNLRDGDARGAYRNVNFDMRMYRRVKMFIHAESAGATDDLEYGDMTCFLRLGSDFDENYYEYEIPLEITRWNETDDEAIWPEGNNMDIELSKLQNLKLARPQGFSTLQEFVQLDGNARLKVKGNPNLANVVTVMVGVRNPRQDDNPWQADDGQEVCAELWVNELRLTDFNEDGGWAALASMNATLADLGTLQLAANISKPGFGGLEQTVQERQRETIVGFDANTTLQMGKLMPERLGVTLPVYLGYSENVSTPQFDPLSPDIELDNRENLSPERRQKSQTYIKRRSFNVTNFRIAPTGNPDKDKKEKKDKDKGKDDDPDSGKEKKDKDKDKKKSNKTPFYAIQNFSFSYAYNEMYMRDINTEFQWQKDYSGGLNYSFNNKPKEVKPFANIGFIKKSKNLTFIKDFNFYTGIQSFSLNTGMDRTYETSRVRNNTLELFGFESDVLINTQVLKTWNWNRQYNVKYDLTKSLKMDFNANTLALVREPQGVIDKEDTEWYAAYRDSVWNEIQGLGERTNYNHGINVSYKVPLDKFPLINFMTADARYAGTYRWDRAPFAQDSLGGTIQNSRNITLNAGANFLNLYNKVELLKDINSGKARRDGQKAKQREQEEDNTKKDGFGQDQEDDKPDPVYFNPFHEFLRLLMTVRNVSASYQRNEGLLLPGYGLSPEFFGMDENFEAPGWGFVLGQQNTGLAGDRVNNYALDAANNGWFLQNPNQNQLYTETYSETWNLRANLEPIKDFKVEVSANRQVARNSASFFRFDENEGDFVFDSPTEQGTFTASVITWGSAWEELGDDFSSPTFRTFLDNRVDISSRLNEQTYQESEALANGFYEGFGPTAQDVVIPAFVAAYTGGDANQVSLDPFKTAMAPNWRITYNGLSKNKRVKKYFKQFSLKHGYRSTMTTQYVFNLAYDEDLNGRPTELDQSENWVSRRQISTVSISEQMNPVVGVDVKIKTKKKNDPNIKLEWKRDRTIALGLSNYQVTETSSNSLVIGVGYKFTDVPNPFGRAKGSRLPIPLLKDTDLELRADLTIRDNVTVIRKMVERQDQVTAGQKIISIKTYAQMGVSEKLDLRLFYDHQLTRPKISTSFPTSNINSGISLRFTLS